jgi:hypothetical protein
LLPVRAPCAEASILAPPHERSTSPNSSASKLSMATMRNLPGVVAPGLRPLASCFDCLGSEAHAELAAGPLQHSQ